MNQRQAQFKRLLGNLLFGLLVLICIVKVAGGVHGTAPAAHAASGPVSTGANVTLADSMLAKTSMDGRGQETCLNELWTRESGFQNLIQNRSSGAFGIAQALGHGTSGSAVTDAVVYFPDGGSARDVNVDEYPSAAANGGNAAAQVTWGLEYIRGTYGSPCGAWAHETEDSWY
jgi:hypothetical protein